MLYTFIAYPVFWALYEQQVSRRFRVRRPILHTDTVVMFLVFGCSYKGFAVDVASDVDERQVGRHRLGDQTRPDANHSPTARSLVDPVVRPRPVPVPSEIRHPAAAAKAHIQQLDGGDSLSARRRSPV